MYSSLLGSLRTVVLWLPTTGRPRLKDHCVELVIVDGNVVNDMYVGHTSGKLIGGGGGYGMMSLDMNVAQQSLMMDPDCLTVCLFVCLFISLFVL